MRRLRTYLFTFRIDSSKLVSLLALESAPNFRASVFFTWLRTGARLGVSCCCGMETNTGKKMWNFKLKECLPGVQLIPVSPDSLASLWSSPPEDVPIQLCRLKIPQLCLFGENIFYRNKMLKLTRKY